MQEQWPTPYPRWSSGSTQAVRRQARAAQIQALWIWWTQNTEKDARCAHGSGNTPLKREREREREKRKVVLYTVFPKRPRVAHMFNHGWWRLAVGGWWRLVVVGGGWWLVIGGWWRLAVVGGWRLLAAGGWWRLVVGSWWRLAVGGWWLAVPWGGP